MELIETCGVKIANASSGYDRPRRRTKPNDEPRAWSTAFKRIMHFVSRKQTLPTCPVGERKPRRHQLGDRSNNVVRCALLIRRIEARANGQLMAANLVRESATHNKDSDNPVGFGPHGSVSNIPSVLQSWQTAGDPRLFKVASFHPSLAIDAICKP